MTVHWYSNGTPPTLVDKFRVDYRYAYGQQRFNHTMKNAGCQTFIEGGATGPSGVWGWFKLPNGTRNCVKGFTGVRPIAPDFVRQAQNFTKMGRRALATPWGEVFDTWVWCRNDGIECFYEHVAPRIWASWQFRRAGDTADHTSMEFYSEHASLPDEGPVELPTECPGRESPPAFDDNVYPDLEKFCREVVNPGEDEVLV